MGGFEVYGINAKKLEGTVLSIYLLFHDADMTVVMLYLLNTPPETPRFGTLHEYRVLRDLFLIDLYHVHRSPHWSVPVIANRVEC